MQDKTDAAAGRRIALVLTAIILGLLAGYALGTMSAPSEAEVAAGKLTAEKTAQAKSYEEAFAKAKLRGARIGAKRGAVSGKRSGRNAGKKTLDARANEAQAQQASEQTACPGGESHIQMGETVCGPGGPARPEDCPSGYVPVGVTGACAPRD